MSAIKIREDRVRRLLARAGYRLKKTPARSHLRKYFDTGYTIVGYYDNIGVLGCYSRMYEATLEDVEEFAARARVF
ncbi:hypothetical protein [Enterovirga rhinocerotis]|uniref:hypothetical protein n=1 Tax=Enterovirga rhinocerotis TaxID=1339210 RepID=UPI00105D3A71|nr:hypothetical protein [Enterovirga rhinocerotis]